MDPVSALGVAAAALQILDASFKAYNAFQEIRNGVESSTERNKQLEESVRSAQNLRASLVSISSPLGATDPMTKLTETCMLKADKLLTLLEYVRGSGKKISPARATLRALRNQKDIAKLYNSLKEDQTTLNQIITYKLLPSIDLLAVQQSEEFANINSITQELVKELIQQRESHMSNHAVLKDTLDGVQHDLKLYVDEASRSARREKLLQSLWFPQIDQRRSEIKEPTPSTLDWLFESTHPKGSGSSTKWSNFRQWLREDTSTYWISGKAGSGKSTLMAHIVNDERTREDLSTWSCENRLEFLSFFFWRAGHELQNSVLGLLRGLLYQLCALQPAFADDISDRFTSVGIPTWTERSLLTYITEAIQSSINFRFCIFIDGLDEYRGPYDDVVDHIDQLQGLGNVKVCISSRPELELVHRFRSLKQLHLQDLNWDDITKFVTQSLSKTQLSVLNRTQLTEAVARRAEGVFLWASLVTQSLVKGAKAGDDQFIMLERLNSLPEDMNKLFKKMLSEVDPVYWKSLAFYVQLMRLSDEDSSWLRLTSISIIATTQLRKRIYSYEEFVKECERTETQITTQSAGLLEIHNDRAKEHLNARKARWEEAEIKHVSNRPGFLLNPEDLNRRRCSRSEPYPIMLNYERRRMNWIHRSAYEFISNQIEKKSLLFELSLDRQELVKQMGEGWISYIMAAPSYVKSERLPPLRRKLAKYGQKPPLKESVTIERLRFFFSNFIPKWKDVFPTTVSTLLDSLWSMCIRINDMDEFYGAREREWFDADANTYTGKVMFWSECALGTVWPYIVSRMNDILEETDGDSLIAHLLACSLYVPEPWSFPIDPADLKRFNDAVAEVLLQRTSQRLECNGAAQATQYKCITKGNTHRLQGSCFSCATWKEPATGRPMDVMTRLIQWLDLLLSGRLRFQNNHVRVPESLSTLMTVSDLYLAPDFRLNRMYIQVSATAWTKIYYAIRSGWSFFRGDIIGNAFHGDQIDGAVRIMCVPSAKKRKIASHKNVAFGYYGSEVSWDPATEWESSRVVTLQPSMVTAARLLGLLAWRVDAGVCSFGMIQNINKRREVCEMLLDEIKTAGQDLDGGQQLIAAACVREGLLDPDIEGIPESNLSR